MQFNLSNPSKPNKKRCILCYRTPQNILMLACDHSICLECAYSQLVKHRTRMNCQIEFQCIKCEQITYFDSGLINQIETSISQLKFKQSTLQKNSYNISQKFEQESFIQKMKKLYFSENHSIQKRKDQPKYNAASEAHIKKITHNIQPKNIGMQNQTQQQTSFQNLPSNGKIQQIGSNTKCQIHHYYQLCYFCLSCRKIVCSQCLLRGSHRDHQNSSISQILEAQLPQFINNVSQKLISEINDLQCNKQKQSEIMEQKIKQIQKIKYDAQKYFQGVKKNIEKQEKQVIQRCKLMLQSFSQQQQEIEQKQSKIQKKLISFIQQIKVLKTNYKGFLKDFSKGLTGRDQQKSLICKYISYSNSISDFFKFKSCQIGSQQKNIPKILTQNNVSNLNKHISQSIQNIKESMVKQPFTNENHYFSKQKSNLQTDFNDSNGTNQISFKPFNKKGIASYIQTQISQGKSKQIKQNNRQFSSSISPYKKHTIKQKYYKDKNVSPYKILKTRNSEDNKKQNKVPNIQTNDATMTPVQKQLYHNREQNNKSNNQSAKKGYYFEKSKKKCYNNLTSYNNSKSKNNSMSKKDRKTCNVSQKVQTTINKFRM